MTKARTKVKIKPNGHRTQARSAMGQTLNSPPRRNNLLVSGKGRKSDKLISKSGTRSTLLISVPKRKAVKVLSGPTSKGKINGRGIKKTPPQRKAYR